MNNGILRALAATLALAAFGAVAQTGDNEAKAAFEAAGKVKVVGPATVPLRDQATLKLPAGQVFIPMPEAGRMMQAIGNGDDPRLMGIVLPAGEEPWLVSIEFVQEGFVKDDDARDWKPDELLKGLREGTEAGNSERIKRGFPALEVVGWAETPRYEASTHRLVWSAAAKEAGAPASQSQTVNYNTYSLGRDGYIALNLITDLDQLPRHRPVAGQLLDGLEYKDGKRYADFNSSTDKVAAYGLAALVAGVAAKKLGLLAIAAAFLLKFAKLIVVAAGGALYGLRKMFGGRKSETA
jgi:uncharacterized membrane-anchored protein